MKTRRLTVIHFYFSDAGDRQRIRLGRRRAITPPTARNCRKILYISGIKENIPRANVVVKANYFVTNFFVYVIKEKSKFKFNIGSKRQRSTS